MPPSRFFDPLSFANESTKRLNECYRPCYRCAARGLEGIHFSNQCENGLVALVAVLCSRQPCWLCKKRTQTKEARKG